MAARSSKPGKEGRHSTTMRLKLLTGVLVVGVAAMAAWFWAGPKAAAPSGLAVLPEADQSSNADSSTITPSSGTAPATEAPKESASRVIAAREGTSGSEETGAATPESKQQAYVAKRVVELQDLGMEDDSASLETILSELENGDPSIRQAAVDAAVQFGSRDALPRLRQAAARADDPKEKSAILEAIEFLSLPTLTEALGQKEQSGPDTSLGTGPGQ